MCVQYLIHRLHHVRLLHDPTDPKLYKYGFFSIPKI